MFRTQVLKWFFICGLFVWILVWRETLNHYEVAEWKSKYETLLVTVEGNQTSGCNCSMRTSTSEKKIGSNRTSDEILGVQSRSRDRESKFIFTDQKTKEKSLNSDFKKQLKSLKLIEYLLASKKAKCSESDEHTFICLSEHNDNPAIACSKKDSEEYKLCTWVKIENLVTEIYKKKLQTEKVEIIRKIYADMVAIVRKSEKEMLERMENQQLSEKQIQFLKMISEGSFDKITANDVYEAIKGLNPSQIFTDFSILSTSKEFPEISAFLPSKRLSEDQFFEIDVHYFEHLSEAINGTLNNAKMNYDIDILGLSFLRRDCGINSKIIMTPKDLWRLRQFFPEGKKPEKYELCYRASENNFDIHKWKEKCGGLTDTVTLVKTTTGKVIGGYTPLSFGTENQTKWQYDENNQTFVFSITENDKYIPDSRANSNSIHYVHENYQSQPQFGFNSDLVISQNSKSNFKSSADIGSKYKNPKYSKGTSEIRRQFTGSPMSRYFSTIEWEFHQMIAIQI